MSVTSLLKLPDVCEQLDRIVPPVPKRISASLVAPPVTSSYALVGTAFDYALRFELERRYPHVRAELWVAETALLSRHLSPDAAALEALADETGIPVEVPAEPTFMGTRKRESGTLGVASQIVRRAREDVASFVRSPNPTPEERRAVAAHAIRLAKLDAVYRAGYVDPKMDTAEPGDVEDVLRLLDVAPCEALTDPQTLWLNPTFGRYSELVGGADCDLVSGDRLIDIKVTKNDAIQQNYMRQLVSYAILGRGVRGEDPAWPDVRHVGIYFTRHGHLWTIPADAIFENPAYADVEAWYFERAAKEFGARSARVAPRKTRTKPVEPAVSVKDKGSARRGKPVAKTSKKGAKKKRAKK